jgi:Cys-tRNA(Pro)/Cys-tRNA(Cys) deacylase
MGTKGTPATEALRRAGVVHRIHEYEAQAAAGRPERGAHVSYGRAAASALGIPEDRIFKTLIAEVDGRLVAAVVPVAGELDPKRLAEAVGGRRAVLAEPPVAQRATGYVVGGISPIGGRRPMPTVVDTSAMGWDTVFVSGGRRGLQVELAPADLVRVTSARTAAVAREG